jgi:hypothetical protein
MAKLGIIVGVTSLFLAGPAGGEVPDLAKDRPDQTESSETVAPGYVQLEFGWTHLEDDEDADVRADSAPETLVRIGVLDSLELRLGFDGYIREEVDSPGARSQRNDGAGDMEVGVKYKLWQEDGWRPQTALLAGTTLPTGARAFSSERFDPSVRLACSHTLSERTGLGYNVAGIWQSDQDSAGDRDTTASVAYSVVLGIALTRQLGTFIEFFGDAPTTSGKPANAFDTGLTYLLAGNLQIDVLGGVALSEAADDWFIGAGLVYRLPR